MIICQTPFRVSFFGGGTDWPEFFETHGGAVLGSAIDKNIYHSVNHFHSRLFDYSIRLSYRRVECVRNVDEVEHRPFREILTHFGITHDIEINLAADLPSFAGLGSSSSFTVGLINALHAFQGRFRSKRDLALAAIRMEREVLGEAIGCQDQVFAAYGGFNLVEFHKLEDFEVHRLVLRNERMEELDGSLLLYFTGVTRRADPIEREKIARVAENTERLRTMRRQVDRAHAILTGDGPLSAFGELLGEAWREKRRLASGVSNPHIDAMFDRALEAGALGGKILGAGGGGFLLLFVPADRQEKLREALREFHEVPFRLHGPGSSIIHS